MRETGDENHLLHLTVTIATLDSLSMLSQTIPRWLSLPIGQLVIVDGGSEDGTQELLEDYCQKDPRFSFIIDRRPGLSLARNIGTSLASCEFVLYAGPDNIVPSSTLDKMLAALDKASLVSCRTRVASGNFFRDLVLNVSKSRLRSGEAVNVVGTPYVGRRELFDRFPFDESVRDSDDTFFCLNLTERGDRIARVDEFCVETGFENYPTLKSRYDRWGRSDAEFYSRKSAQLSVRKRLISFTRPFWVEAFAPFLSSNLGSYLLSFPFLLWFGFLRFSAFRRELSNYVRMG